MARRFLAVFLASLSLVLTLARPARASDPTLAVGTVTGAPGTTVNLPVQFTPGTTGISAIQFDLTLPTTLVWVSSTAGAAATAADKMVQGAATAGVARTIIFGINQTTIGAGVIATVQLTIDPSAPSGPIAVPISNVVASDPNGIAVTADGSDGTVTVGDADGGEESDAAAEDGGSPTDGGGADVSLSDATSTDAAGSTDGTTSATDAPAGTQDSSTADAASKKDASSSSTDAAPGGSDASGPVASGSSKSSGCGCREAASSGDAYGAYALAIAAGLATVRRRRRDGGR